MRLTDSELAELRELQMRAYGRHADGALDDASRKRLLELEQSQLPPGVSDGGAPAAGDERSEPVELLEDAGEPHDARTPRRMPAWAVFVAAAAGIAVGLLVALGLGALHLSELTGSAAPQVPDAEDWDAGSIRYLGTFRTAHFWLTSRDEGETTCLVVEDPPRQVTHSTRTCKPTDVALEAGLTTGSASSPGDKPTDALSTVHLFAVVFSGEDPTLRMIEKVTDDPQTTLRDLGAILRAS